MTTTTAALAVQALAADVTEALDADGDTATAWLDENGHVVRDGAVVTAESGMVIVAHTSTVPLIRRDNMDTALYATGLREAGFATDVIFGANNRLMVVVTGRR